MDLAHGQGNPFFGFFPGNMLTSASARASRTPWRRRKGGPGHRRAGPESGLATAHEIPCHGEDEVGVGLEHPGHELVDRRVVISGRWAVSAGPTSSRTRLRTSGRASPAATHGLRQNGRDNTIGRALQETPDEGPADAEPITMNLSMPR